MAGFVFHDISINYYVIKSYFDRSYMLHASWLRSLPVVQIIILELQGTHVRMVGNIGHFLYSSQGKEIWS